MEPIAAVAVWVAADCLIDQLGDERCKIHKKYGISIRHDIAGTLGHIREKHAILMHSNDRTTGLCKFGVEIKRLVREFDLLHAIWRQQIDAQGVVVIQKK